MEIKFSGVTKIFEPDIIALEDIYLQVEKGEFVYLVGETGSGKTTLMRCITREVVPTRGQISVGGNLLRKINRFDLALFRRDIGVVFQSFLLLPNLTAFENGAETCWYMAKKESLPSPAFGRRAAASCNSEGDRQRAVSPDS